MKDCKEEDTHKFVLLHLASVEINNYILDVECFDKNATAQFVCPDARHRMKRVRFAI